MSNYLVTDTELTQTANAIRTKGGTSGQISFVSGTGFKSAIEALPSGGSGVQFGTSFGSATPLEVVNVATASLPTPILGTNYSGVQ